MTRIALGIAAGLAVSAIVVAVGGIVRGPRHPHTRLVAEDPSAPLARIAIHYEREGFAVHRIDVTPIYQLDGSLGCLVNVLARGVAPSKT